MSPTTMALLAMILEALPLAIKGVESAVALVESGSKLFSKVINENRDPTEAEVASVRQIREQHYTDFYEDDEAEPT